MACDKCGDTGSYGATDAAEERRLPDGSTLVFGPGYRTVLCACRVALPPREGRAAWWTQEQIYRVEVRILIFDESVSITVRAEVPVSDDNYRVTRRGNRYYPTLINIKGPNDMTLHSDTARTLARALLDAADAAERVDDADTDPRCGHWAPCDCVEAARSDSAVDPSVSSTGTPSTRV